MKEMPVARMNFLRHVGRGLTYKGMFSLLAGWCAFLALIYGIQYLRAHDIDRDVNAAKDQIVALNAAKERQIEFVRSFGKKRMTVAAKENIETIIALRPRWSKVLRGLVHALPADVWLEGVTVGGGVEEWYTLEIKGRAKTQRALTTFILQLEGSGLFRRTALENTKQAEDKTGIFEYELSTQPVMKRLTEDD